ncbi:hypothetical protein LCGC14_3148600, partial [marine sediment metagenome]
KNGDTQKVLSSMWGKLKWEDH